jgi:hypothetical protein
MEGRDRGLHGEGTYGAAKRFVDQRQRLGNLLAIPAAAILLFQKD